MHVSIMYKGASNDTEKYWLLCEWTLPNALEANKLMALCKRSGLMAWTINTCLRTKTANLV